MIFVWQGRITLYPVEQITLAAAIFCHKKRPPSRAASSRGNSSRPFRTNGPNYPWWIAHTLNTFGLAMAPDDSLHIHPSGGAMSLLPVPHFVAWKHFLFLTGCIFSPKFAIAYTGVFADRDLSASFKELTPPSVRKKTPWPMHVGQSDVAGFVTTKPKPGLIHSWDHLLTLFDVNMTTVLTGASHYILRS